ncbi:MAG TPA: N-carbamoylputrescine amidase [Sandaracinaceae bacterium LLY-WYZ-13_1]|nr:N-carbamoylputrescine amidase [Sandaracinaceae bacterium LLY-WYZ-13_1]
MTNAPSDEPLSLSVLQCALNEPREINVARVVGLIREAAEAGGEVILAPELFEGPYFPKDEDEDFFEWARPLEGNRTLERLQELAAELGVVLPYSWFEHAGQSYYNSLAMIDADGSLLGVYRKSHIPDGPGYEEKYYFRPGDTGFKVWKTRHGALGVGICWDQWFPECARAMALMGAEALMYPTAIGSEPKSGEHTKGPWQRCMIGHAVANAMPVAAANRVGDESGQVFYGSSFIADPLGEKVAELGSDEQGFLVHAFDRRALIRRRASWGFFRDRRPDLYDVLLSADGRG